MCKNVSRRLLLILFVCCSFRLNAQMIDSMMKVYAEEYPEQKLHVHFDKDIYRAGETIWFKAYLFAGYLPAINSKNFYAELIDANGKVVQRKVYPIIESSAAGNFDIAANAPAANYKFRAYTTWMLNFDSSFIYTKDIIVSDKAGVTKNTIERVNIKMVDVQFFPEGGNLVDGIESIIAFKANDAQGKPVNISGAVTNTAGVIVASITTMHDGMGTFAFSPASGEQYIAKWRAADGREGTTPLPAAQADGIVLHIENVPGKKVFILKRSISSEKYASIRLLAQVGQEVVYKARVPLANFANSGFIPVENMPSGIMTITAFTDDWQPLAERIVMVNNHNYQLNAEVSVPVIDLKKRARNVVEVSIADTNLTNLSVSISDAGLSNNQSNNTIVSSLLLTGDLKGHVNNPAYYFTNKSDSLAKQLDLVMLTHGWRRYKWQDLVQGKVPKLKYPQDQYLSLRAKVFGVTSASALRPDEQLIAILQTKDSLKQVFLIPKVGRDSFVVDNLNFFDTAKVYYQFTKNTRLNGTASVAFNNGLYSGNKSVFKDSLWDALIPFDTSAINRNKLISNEVAKYGSNFNTGNVLEAVTVKTRVKTRAQQLDDLYASGLFTGDNGFSFDLVNDPSAMSAINIFTYLQSRVPGLTISNPTGPGTSVTWRQSATSLFLNEMPVDAEQVSSISVNDIAYVKVFRPPFFGAGGGGAGGGIAIYTRKGNDVVQTTSSKGLEMNTIVGYSSLKEFYMPNYGNSDELGIVADYRTTLYWNPYVFLDGGKRIMKIEFYNNDVTTSYKVVVEGVNEIGKMVHIEKVVQ